MMIAIWIRLQARRVALVTGASAGNGDATVCALLATGMTVYAAARRVERMAPLATLGARVIALDVTDDAAMIAAIDRIRDEAGRLDVLVNNAGYGAYGAIEDVPLSEARRQFEVNVFAAARLIQLALPMMRVRRSGTIVNISSMGGKMYEPFDGWYHATKFALEGRNGVTSPSRVCSSARALRHTRPTRPPGHIFSGAAIPAAQTRQ